jgi:hypothetical protein
MDEKTKDAIQNLIYYYDHHGIEKIVRGDEERLKGFVIDDFTKLLDLLRPVVFEVSNA